MQRNFHVPIINQTRKGHKDIKITKQKLKLNSKMEEEIYLVHDVSPISADDFKAYFVQRGELDCLIVLIILAFITYHYVCIRHLTHMIAHLAERVETGKEERNKQAV